MSDWIILKRLAAITCLSESSVYAISCHRRRHPAISLCRTLAQQNTRLAGVTHYGEFFWSNNAVGALYDLFCRQ